MASRLELHETLCKILGTRNAYFQPPASVQLKYDAIVYALADIYAMQANDDKYHVRKIYTIAYIHKDPDSEIVDEILMLPMCSFDRRYVVDNLYHDVFTLYY